MGEKLGTPQELEAARLVQEEMLRAAEINDRAEDNLCTKRSFLTVDAFH
jgi:hypothetical protein